MADLLTTPRTEAELRQAAADQVGSEVAGEVAPYQTQVGTLQGRETTSLANIGKMFEGLQPIVSGGAAAVSQSYDAAKASENEIFQQAGARLNSLRQSRAAEAQKLAQEMGGPVALGEFTGSVDPSIESFIPTAAGSMLHTLADAQAGVQESQAFAGKVFPALRVEEEANARNSFEEKISELQNTIAQIRASTTGRTNSRLNELLQGEREFELQKAQSDLEKVKADRDWEATKKSLALDTARVNLAKQQFGIQQAGVTGTYKGKPTLASRSLSVQEKQAAAKLGLSEAQYQLAVAKAQHQAAVDDRGLDIKQQGNAIKLIDSATGSGGAATITQRHYLTSAQALQMLDNPKLHIQGKVGGKDTKYWINEDVKVNTGTTTHDPNQLYQMLLGANIPKSMAQNLVKTKLGLPDWTPGKLGTQTRAQLETKDINALVGIARQLGWKPTTQRHNTSWFVDWIIAHQ